jgi:membrane-bound metal-dependent hydrolase YbcI (DUF457 family)
MDFFVHLLAGIILGISLNILFRDTRLFLAGVLGSILPDLIDKPIGILLIPYARSYAHTLLFVGLLMGIGIGVYLMYPRNGLVILSLVAGIFLHDILDAMWLWPSHWFWPALGSFNNPLDPDFVSTLFWREITNPIEWLAAICILAIIIISFIPYYRKRAE